MSLRVEISRQQEYNSTSANQTKKAETIEIPIGKSSGDNEDIKSAKDLYIEEKQQATFEVNTNNSVNSSSTGNKLYTNVQNIDLEPDNTSMTNGYEIDESTVNEMKDISEEIGHDVQNDLNTSMMLLNVPDGFHGSATTDNCVERDWGFKSQSLQTNNSGYFTYKKGNTNTALGFSYEYSTDKYFESDETSNKKYQDTETDSSSEGTYSLDEKDKENEIHKMLKLKTKTDLGDNLSDEEAVVNDSETKPQSSTLNSKCLDLFILHNRKLTINESPFVLGLGGDLHTNNDGKSESLQYSIRAGLKSQSGMAVFFDTTYSGQKNEDGDNNHKRETRVHVTFLDNETDEINQDYVDKNGEEQFVSEIKTRNRVGLDLVVENSEFGIKPSLLIYDNGKEGSNKYSRTQLYVEGKLADETTKDNDDRFKFEAGLVGKYEHVTQNGNYLKALGKINMKRTLQKGYAPADIIFGKATLEAKVRKNKFEALATYIKTSKFNIFLSGVSYKYSAKNYDIGVSCEYTVGKILEMDTKYLNVGVSGSYKF